MADTDKETILAALTKGLTPQQINRLQKTTVAIVGCGGLGSNIAMELTRAGIGCLHLIDFDRVELSNLNRQYYFLEDVGSYKVDALAQQLKRINPYIQLRLTQEPLTEDNLYSLLQDSDYICEALDKADTKALLVTNVLADLPHIPLVSGSGIAGLGDPNEIMTRKLRNNFYLSGDGNSDFKDNPLCGARVILCASHQALTLLRLILNLEK